MDKLKKFLQVACYFLVFVILALVVYKLVYSYFIEPRQVQAGVNELFRLLPELINK